MNGFFPLIKRWFAVNGFTLNPSNSQTVNFSMRREQYLKVLFESHKVCTTRDYIIKTASKISYLSVGFIFDLF